MDKLCESLEIISVHPDTENDVQTSNCRNFVMA